MSHSLYESLAKINAMLESTQTPEYEQEWIKTCEAIHYPKLLDQMIVETLKINQKQDVSNVIHTLYQLQKQGMNYLWDSIKDTVRIRALKACGTVFPQKSIDKGREHPIHLTPLILSVHYEINTVYGAKFDMSLELRLLESLLKHVNDAEFRAYFDAHQPEIKIPNIQNASDLSRVSDTTASLVSLSQHLDHLAQTSLNMLELLQEPIQRRHSPHFFQEHPDQQGCEYIPGSYYDESGHIRSPRP